MATTKVTAEVITDATITAAKLASTTGSGAVVLATSPTLVTPLLGTPTSGTLTNATGLPLTSGVTGTLPVASGGTGVTSSTGTGANVLGTSPTLVTPALGTPASGILTSCTGLNYTGFKNRIINGAMMIDQRNAGAAVTVNIASSVFSVDRWFGYGQATDGVFTLQQLSDAPAGFTTSIKATVTTADASIGASQIYLLSQVIEANNIYDLDWGLSTAKPVVLSFWVKSSVTGTYGGSVTNNTNYSYPFSYAISSSNTWEYKTITISGPTAGTWGTGTAAGLTVRLSLGSGSSQVGTAGAWTGSQLFGVTGQTNIISTNGATFYLTGVQLEVGSTATSFDYRPYGTELALCQRYYLKLGPGNNVFLFDNYNVTSSSCNLPIVFPVQMRSTPTGSFSSISHFGFSNTNSGSFNVSGRTPSTATVGADASASARCQWYTSSASAFIAFDIEL